MNSILGWAIRHPLHAGILVGLSVAIFVGVVSLPDESSLQKTVSDWLPPNATQDEHSIDQLITVLEAARENQVAIERVSEREFRDLELERSYAFPRAEDETFTIEYVGQEALSDDTIYLAERRVEPAPWWHPDRLLYRAAGYQVDRFGTGLELTFERDWNGIGALLLLDALIGSLYGAMVALMLGAFGSKGLEASTPANSSQFPAETPLAIFRTGQFKPDRGAYSHRTSAEPEQ